MIGKSLDFQVMACFGASSSTGHPLKHFKRFQLLFEGVCVGVCGLHTLWLGDSVGVKGDS